MFGQSEKLTFLLFHMGAVVSDIQEAGRLYRLSWQKCTHDDAVQFFVQIGPRLRDHVMLSGKFFDALRRTGIALLKV